MKTRIIRFLFLLAIAAVFFSFNASIKAETIHYSYFPVVFNTSNLPQRGLEVWGGGVHKDDLLVLQPDYVRYSPGTSGVPPRPSIWPAVEYERGVYDWAALQTPFETDIKDILSTGANPVVVLHGAPVWATEDGSNCGILKRENYDDFVKFTSAFLTRYPEIKYVEIWNEPDSGKLDEFLYGCWDDSQNDAYERFGEFVAYAYNALKPIFSDVTFISGGFADVNNFARAVDRINADVVAIHRYSVYVPDYPGYWKTPTEETLQYTKQLVIGRFRIWFNETNLLNPNNVCDQDGFEADQADYINFVLNREVDAVFIYALTTYKDSWCCAALLKSNGQPTAGYEVFASYSTNNSPVPYP